MLTSVLLTMGGGVCLFVAGGFLFPYLSHEQRKKIGRDIWSLVGFGLSGVAVVVFIYSYRYHYASFAGKMITPEDLDVNMIYEVATQVVIPEVGNATIVANARRKPQLVGPQQEPLTPGSRFVRPMKSPDGKWILEPMDVPWPGEKKPSS